MQLLWLRERERELADLAQRFLKRTILVDARRFLFLETVLSLTTVGVAVMVTSLVSPIIIVVSSSSSLGSLSTVAEVGMAAGFVRRV